jgi:hypothetical protein
MAAGVVFIPWYATGFRGDGLEAALGEIAPVAMRYGATGYSVYRSRDDRYKFLQTAYFNSHEDWERYWYGEEMSRFRTDCSSWYQIPVLYYWNDLVTAGTLQAEPAESR